MTPEYGYVLTFGQDDSGPWAALGCSAPGCGRHQAVRPEWNGGAGLSVTDGELLDVLVDFAHQDGWRVELGAWCPEHEVSA